MSNYDYTQNSDIENLNQVVAITLDEAKATVDQIIDVFDVDTAPADALPIIGSLFGFSIDTTEDIEYQRKLLRTSIDLIKNKGTLTSFKVLFYNLGFNIKIVPQWTADWSEEVVVNLPYIRLTNLIPNEAGLYDIVVMNPDEQYDTLENGIEYSI